MSETGKHRARWRRDALIVGLALSLRLAHLAFVAANPMFHHPVLDPKYYDDWGLRIASGQVLGSEVFEMSPLYPYLLGGLYAVAGHAYVVVGLVQALLGAGTCWFLLRIGDRVFGRAAGTWTGILAGVYPVFLYYDIMVMKTSLGIFLACGALFFLARGPGRARDALFAGLMLGGAVLVRDNYLLALPLLALWLGVREGLGGRGRPAAAVALAGGCALAILPVTARNLVVAGDLVLTTSGGGEVFYVGNNPRANGLYQYPPFVRADPQYEHEDFRKKAREESGRDLTRAESSRFWWHKGVAFLTGHPLDALVLYLRKFALVWNAREVPDNYSFEFFRREVSPVLRLPLGFSLVAALGLVGVAMSLGKWRRCLPLYLFEIAYMGGLLLFFVHSRYRLPMVPVLLVFCGAALVGIAGAYRRARWGTLGAAAAGAAAVYAFTLVPLVPPSYFDPWNLYEKLGVAFMEDGMERGDEGALARARGYLEESLRLNERNPNVHYNLGLLAQHAGDLRGAYARYQRAAELSPLFRGAHEKLEILSRMADVGLFDRIEERRRALEEAGEPPGRIHFEIGSMLLRERVLGSAIPELEQAVSLAPGSVQARLKLAEAYSRNGEHARAVSVAKELAQKRPRDAEALGALARCYVAGGEFAPAEEVLRRAVSIAPDRIELVAHLAQAEAGLGRTDMARRLWKEVLRRGAEGRTAELARTALRQLGR